jgi:hypothetical protein
MSYRYEITVQNCAQYGFKPADIDRDGKTERTYECYADSAKHAAAIGDLIAQALSNVNVPSWNARCIGVKEKKC